MLDSTDGSDNNPSRAFYFATWGFTFNGVRWDLGGGFHTLGALDAGFGQIGAQYKKYAGLLRLGSQDTVHLEARYKVAQFGEHVSLWPVYSYYHAKTGPNRDIDIHSIGARFVFGKSY
jgi:hypothetical protein